MNCIKCDVELNDDNWWPSYKKYGIYICSKCGNKISKEYFKTEKGKEVSRRGQEKYRYTEKGKIKIKEWENSLSGKESKQINNKKHREKYKEKRNEYKKKYDKTPQGIESKKKSEKKYSQTTYGKENKRENKKKNKNKRKRNLGFNPLNTWFENSHAHHINLNDVMYVPKEYNKICYHNVFTGYNMEIVNTYAYFFLIMNNIGEIKCLI